MAVALVDASAMSLVGQSIAKRQGRRVVQSETASVDGGKCWRWGSFCSWMGLLMLFVGDQALPKLSHLFCVLLQTSNHDKLSITKSSSAPPAPADGQRCHFSVPPRKEVRTAVAPLQRYWSREIVRTYCRCSRTESRAHDGMRHVYFQEMDCYVLVL